MACDDVTTPGVSVSGIGVHGWAGRRKGTGQAGDGVWGGRSLLYKMGSYSNAHDSWDSGHRGSFSLSSSYSRHHMTIIVFFLLFSPFFSFFSPFPLLNIARARSLDVHVHFYIFTHKFAFTFVVHVFTYSTRVHSVISQLHT